MEEFFNMQPAETESSVDCMMSMVPKKPVPTLDTIDAKSLSEEDFPPVVWLIEGLITAGLSLLVGSPKIGKSFLALEMAVHIAIGEELFNKTTSKSAVLYFALEDSPRRLQGRLKMLSVENPPGSLHFATSIPEDLELKDFIKVLENYIDEHPEIKCIFIDTMQRVRQASSNDTYSTDTAFLVPYQEIAIKRGISIIMIHHTRKSDAEDPFMLISGTQGLMGVSDTAIVVTSSRGTPDRIMYITGRDVNEAQLAFSFDAGHWELLGDASEVQLSKERKKILEVMKDIAGEPGPKEIAELTGIPYSSVKNMLPKMVKEGHINKLARGKYRRSISSLNIKKEQETQE